MFDFLNYIMLMFRYWSEQSKASATSPRGSDKMPSRNKDRLSQ